MKRRQQARTTYTHLDALMASPDQPLPQAKRRHQLTRMWSGLASLESSPEPSYDDWRVCSDAVNLMETLVDMSVCEDSSGLLHDAVTALAIAGARHIEKNVPIRLDGPGMLAVRAILEDYAAVLEQIPARTAIMAHIKTERRAQEILRGKRKPHDIKLSPA